MIIHHKETHDGSLTIFENGDYILVQGDPDRTDSLSTYYQAGQGPERMRHVVDREVQRHHRLLALRQSRGTSRDLPKRPHRAGPPRRPVRTPQGSAWRLGNPVGPSPGDLPKYPHDDTAVRRGARADAHRTHGINRELQSLEELANESEFGILTSGGGFSLGRFSAFDGSRETDPEYLLSYFEALERAVDAEPIRASMGVVIRGLTRYLWELFPALRGWHGVRRLAGTYRTGGRTTLPRGHHIFMKAGFPRRHWSRMFSISPEAMARLGWNHDLMSATQRRLFRMLARSGRPNTLQEHVRIALAALRAGHATDQQARWLVAQALRNLRQLGKGRVLRPTRMPYGPP
jgi:hypothetical protein